MKKIVLAVAVACGIWGVTSCSEDTKAKMTGKIPETDVPAPVRESFNTKYTGATDVQWEKETKDSKLEYEAEFKMNDKEMEAFFDESGNFLREEND